MSIVRGKRAKLAPKFRHKLIYSFIASALSITTQAGSEQVYSPYASATSTKRVLWGDTHLHTDLSLDARAFGVRLDTATAYRFARGEQVNSTSGQPVRLSRPLDFLVVADHSDAMGVMKKVLDSNDPKFTKEPIIQGWRQRLLSKGGDAYQAGMDVVAALTLGNAPKVVYEKDGFKEVWKKQVATADQFNEPGRFTALIGYEWTSTPQGNNLHRNILYRDDASFAEQVLPFTSAESSNPEDLWKWLESYEKKTGGKVIALAHNGNLSNGLMFPDINPATQKPFTKEYLETRARWEPLYEVTQIKGDGEAHPLLSPNDEFADFENWDTGNLGPSLKQDDMLQYEYAREALKNGLKFQTERGLNPYQFGMIGSTDAHTALATADSDNFYGKMAYMEPSPDRWKHLLGSFGEMKVFGWEMVASGYAAVWAEDNTREAIFDAMQRREVYATTGPRITLRFDLQNGKNTLPMGSIVKDQQSAPTFQVDAMMDPTDAKLDRVQIIKGWVDANGKTQEKIYEVAWAGKRKLSRKGTLKPIGSTVNAKTAEYTNDIGSRTLRGEWQDPDFTPGQSAFYYARVLQIPTPRWTTYDAARYGIKLDSKIPTEIQERAYSSPIWLN
ncbi:DUF3604 domain-containing protein [Spongiibacter sp. KMU-158]|uniref:DUF3604 domain-containing protein n=1 Tax=Spongiibacter pelagi TaxID=2760804 RepID=A0A927C047_9GAMM|nr:DUF3604 domain-containing protein [Spongiibacter pelagi]MBD2858795.1 DUF3604 domain-containing protein [Spongiibacter pelagi]